MEQTLNDYNKICLGNASLNEAVLSLFKGFVLGQNDETNSASDVEKMQEKAAKNGIFVPENILAQISSEEFDALISAHGYDIVKTNQAALHKSFRAIAESSVEKLFIQQALHYMSVFMQYGNEFSPEEVDSSIVYIPCEKLNLPEGEPVRFVVIQEMTMEEVVQKAKNMLASGMALNLQTESYLLSIVKQDADSFSLDEIKNKEFKILLMDVLRIMPKKAGEFLRFLVMKKTGRPMILHTKDAVRDILDSSWNSEQAFISFVEQNGIEPIAKEFNRHKKFWISFKKDGKFVAKVINKARKLSVSMNRPHLVPVLDRIGDKNISLKEVEKELAKVTLSKKVSVANSLLRRAANPLANLFVIRNGRAFVQETDTFEDEFMTAERKKILVAVIKSIVEDIRPNVEGKKICLPENMDYAFPVSEKMFVGNIPFYSTLTLPENAILGIHWFNVKNGKRVERVDLDLHYVAASGEHVGWCTFWDKRKVLHSGDMTNAPLPNGATEAVYVPEEVNDDFATIYLNMYTDNTVEVPYSLFVGEADRDHVSSEYLISSQQTALHINGLSIERGEDTIGFLESAKDGKKFHFMKTSAGNGRVARSSERNLQMIEAIKATLHSRLSLSDILAQAGAVFEKEADEDWDIDLSFNHLTKDSFSFLFP